MLKLLSDENFNGDIIRGLFHRRSDIDLIRVQDVNLRQVDDPEILAWAAINCRILLTHDKATMPGLFVVNDRMSIRQAIDELLLLNDCTEQVEWNGIVLYLPL